MAEGEKGLGNLGAEEARAIITEAQNARALKPEQAQGALEKLEPLKPTPKEVLKTPIPKTPEPPLTKPKGGEFDLEEYLREGIRSGKFTKEEAERMRRMKPIAGGALYAEFEPGGMHPDDPDEWFQATLRSLEQQDRYFGIQGWEMTPGEEQIDRFLRFMEHPSDDFRSRYPTVDFRRKHEELRDQYEARTVLHNLALCLEKAEDLRDLEEFSALAKRWKMEYFNIFFELPGTGEALRQYEVRGNDLIDAKGKTQKRAISVEIQNNIAPNFNPAQPAATLFINTEDSERIGYRLWVIMLRKAYYQARQLPRKEPGWTPFNSLPPDLDLKILNHPVASLYFPFTRWCYYQIGEELGGEIQKYLWDNRFDLGIFDFFSRRATAIFGTWRESPRGEAFLQQTRAAIQRANPRWSPEQVEKELERETLEHFGLVNVNFVNIWGEQRKDFWGEVIPNDGFIENLSQFPFEEVDWTRLPREELSFKRNIADHILASKAKGDVEEFIALPFPEMYGQIGNVKGYTSAENWQKIYAQLLKTTLHVHESKIPFLTSLGPIPLSTVQRIRSWQAADFETVHRFIDSAVTTGRITQEQANAIKGVLGRGARVAAQQIQPQDIAGGLLRGLGEFIKALLK
jgi:hypothetical protein